MSKVLVALSAVVVCAAAAPALKESALFTDLDAAGNFMASYVKTYPEYKIFYQIGLPIAASFVIPEETRKTSLVSAYVEYGPQEKSSTQVLNEVELLLHTVEQTKDEYLRLYFNGNIVKGVEVLSKCGYLFAQDYYMLANAEKKKILLKQVLGDEEFDF